MNPSPLLLESYSFRKISIEAQSDPNPDDANQMTVGFSVGQDRGSTRRFRVILDVQLGATKDARPKYLGELEIVGVFRVAPDWSEDKIAPLVSNNGPTLLYGAMREMVINLTSRMQHGPITLRTVSFPPSELKVDDKQRKPAAKRKARLSSRSTSAQRHNR